MPVVVVKIGDLSQSISLSSIDLLDSIDLRDPKSGGYIIYIWSFSWSIEIGCGEGGGGKFINVLYVFSLLTDADVEWKLK